MKNYLSIFLIFSIGSVFGQVAPSPDALGTVTASAQEDLFRGFVTESIPLYNIQADNGYQVPVQLTYQTRGIRVADIASSVGLGWNLAAGGAITRVMRDEPDEQSTFIDNPDAQSVRESQGRKSKGYDFEKDIFYYSSPSGGGSFISTKEGTFISGGRYTEFYGLPYTDNHIEFYYTNSSTSYWRITDTQGIQYVYGQSASAREITHSQQYEQGEVPVDNADFTYISTWYLEEIIFPNLPSDQNIQFTYTKGTKKLSTTSTFSTQVYELALDKTLWYYNREDNENVFWAYKRNPFNGDCCSIYSIPMTGNIPKEVTGYGPIQTEYVTGLYDYRKLEDPCGPNSGTDCIDNIKGSFLGDNIVDDPEHYETPIEVYREPDQPSGETIFYSKVEITPSMLSSIEGFKSTVEFVHTSRIDVNAMSRISQVNVKDHNGKKVITYDLEHDYFDASDYHGGCTSNANCKRLKLESISRNGFELGRFQYMNELDASLELPSREPGIGEPLKMDRFGYYKSDVISRYEQHTFNQFTSDNPAYETEEAMLTIGPDNNRAPNMDARANSLWKITYPTGGTKEFSYKDKPSGGIVISSVKVIDGSEIIGHTSYSYGGELVMRSDLHAITEGPSVLLFSNSPYLTFDYMNSGGFSSAVAKNLLLGTSVRYTYYKSNLQDEGDKSIWSLSNNTWDKEEDIENNNAPIMPPNYYPQHGLPRLIQVYDQDSKLISETSFFYINESSGNEVQEHAFVFTGTTSSGSYYSSYGLSRDLYHVGQSTIDLSPLQLDYTISEMYEDGIAITSKTAYSYHSTYQTLPKEVETYRISDSEDRLDNTSWNDTKTVTYYTGDHGVLSVKSLPGTSILPSLVTKNMIGLPVATENWIKSASSSNYRLTNVSYTSFQNINGLIFPYKTYTSEFNQLKTSWNGTSITEVGTSSYDNNGRMISISDISGITSSYVYDASGYLESESTSAGGMTRTTAYSHLPLIGVETITGPDGRTSTYEYDDRNRLHVIRNNEGDILNRYRYNYQSEDNRLVAEIELSGQPLAGRNVTFKAADLTAYGGMDNTQMHWSISQGGNGSITIGEPTVVDELYSGEGSTAAVTFNEIGDYSVRLSLYNPEYDEPKVIYKNISINNQFWSPGTPTGITSACACSGVGDAVLDGPFLNDDGNNDCVPVVGVYARHVQHGSTSCGDTSANLTYEWEYKSSNNANWISFGNNTSAALPGELYSSPKTVQIRYKVSDTCGVTKTSTEISVNINYCN